MIGPIKGHIPFFWRFLEKNYHKPLQNCKIRKVCGVLWLPATEVHAVNHRSYIDHQSHWWNWVQTNMRPHLWTSPRCCQDCHAHQGWSGWTPCHHSINSNLLAEQSTACSHSKLSVASTTLRQAAAWSPTTATHIQWMIPATAEGQPLTDKADVAPQWSGHVSKHHSALMNRCKYNCDDVTGWASAPTHKQLRFKDT